MSKPFIPKLSLRRIAMLLATMFARTSTSSLRDSSVDTEASLSIGSDFFAAQLPGSGGELAVGGQDISREIAETNVGEALKPRVLSANMTASAFQAIIDERKKSAARGFVDLSDLKDVVLQGVPTDFGYEGSYYRDKVRDVISGLNVSGTNFAQVFNIDGLYFRDCDFSGSRFKDTTDVTFDGCDLSGVDMSGTMQRGLSLGDDIAFVGREISALDRRRIHGVANPARAIAQLQARRDRAERHPTKFTGVKLEGATLHGILDNVFTDYENTSFRDVRILVDDGFAGQNLNLTGALYSPVYPSGEVSSEEFLITAPVSAEEVGERAGGFVESMLRSNLINPLSGEKTKIAIAGSAISGNFSDVLARCDEVWGSQAMHEPVSIGDSQNLVKLFNEQYAAYNVEFLMDNADEDYDFRLTFCQTGVKTEVASNQGYAAIYGYKNRENFIAIGINTVKDPSTTLHELGHSLGATHPFETSISALKCSTFSSVVCYDNALDIMFPLGQEKRPAHLHVPEDLAPNDHKMAALIFGKNPAYQGRDIVTPVALNQSRLIAGDLAFNNTATIDTTSLPAGVKVAVLDAASAIGTCYDFPCDPSLRAAGTEGVLAVLYRDAIGDDRPEIVSSVLLFGGRSNDVLVDGVKVEPIIPNITAEFPSPTSSSSQSQGPSPTSSSSPAQSQISSASKDSSTKDSLNKIIAGVASASGILLVAAAGIACCAMRNRRRVAEFRSVSQQSSSSDTVVEVAMPGTNVALTSAAPAAVTGNVIGVVV